MIAELLKRNSLNKYGNITVCSTHYGNYYVNHYGNYYVNQTIICIRNYIPVRKATLKYVYRRSIKYKISSIEYFEDEWWARVPGEQPYDSLLFRLSGRPRSDENIFSDVFTTLEEQRKEKLLKLGCVHKASTNDI